MIVSYVFGGGAKSGLSGGGIKNGLSIYIIYRTKLICFMHCCVHAFP